MNNENNLTKKKEQSNSFLENFSENKVNSILERFSLIINNHRLVAQTQIQNQPINLPTFLSILPFFIGFFQFIHKKYNFDKSSLILEKNLPAIKIPTEKLDLETLIYLDNNLKLDKISPLKKIYWSDKDLIIQVESQKDYISTFFDTPTLIKIIPNNKKVQKTENIKSNYFTLSSQPTNLNRISNFYQNLDEIPNKLESNFSLSSQMSGIRKVGKKKVLPIENNLIEKNELKRDKLLNSNNLLQSNSKSFSIKEILVSQPILPNFNVLVGFENTFKMVPTNQFQKQKKLVSSSIFHLSNQFLLNSKILQKEYNQFFLQTGHIPSSTSNLSNFSSKKDQLVQNANLIQTSEKKFLSNLLEDINTLHLQEDFINGRRMTGYKFPDMSPREVGWFLIEKYLSSTRALQNLQLSLPTNFVLTNKYFFPEIPNPNILIGTKSLELKNSSTDNLSYQGPSILTQTEVGLDWAVKFGNNKQNLIESGGFRNWVEFYLSTLNPFSDGIKNFFGVYHSPEFNETRIQNNNELEKNYWFSELPFFRNGIISNPDSSFLNFERSFQIPYMSQNEWNLNFQKNFENAEIGVSNNEFSEVPLPLVETRIPTNTNFNYLFGFQPLVDYQFINPVITKGRLAGDFLPEIWDSLQEESFVNHYSSGIYQRINSSFKLTSSNSTNFFLNPYTFFYNIWEPLTFRSWLIVSQIGFAFLVFSILKALADNYGRELLVYLLDLVALLGFLDEDLKQEIEILMGQREKGFRIISKTRKNFKDIAGIEKLLPEIIEIVWFLRNSGREFALSKTLPRGVLLTGPPGTGKTLLVQALAGEAEVPVLALSGSSLIEPGESGALKLEILFQEARRLAPCIVFIDEIDTLAEKRQQVLQNPMGADEVLESLHRPGTGNSADLNIQKLLNNNIANSETFSNSDDLNTNENLVEHQDMQREKLRILMQFLVELDGIQGRDGVVVVGATNRPEMLDPAILRPGRFDRVVELGLPGPEKRKEILKLYSTNLGIAKTVSWDYLANRTAGFSAADLASIMNQSSLKAITLNSQHTIETIEHGIDRITTFEIEKPKLSLKNNLIVIRRAYYQAGKILLSMLLEHHPSTLITYLWTRRTNIRALQISNNVQNYFFKFARRLELEHRLIGCYAGKAAEILFLQTTNAENINVSDLGMEDIQFGQNLIKLMTETWYLYAQRTILGQFINITENRNSQEYQNNLGQISFFEKLNEENENGFLNSNFGVNLTNEFAVSQNSNHQQAQSHFSLPWWQYQISSEFEISTRSFSDWYRLYLPDPQEIERNLEWTPPDEFYHSNNSLNLLSPNLDWNMLDSITTDYQNHSLVLQSFNKALTMLEKNREILDFLAYELVQYEVLRQPEIEKIFENFGLSEFCEQIPKSVSKDLFFDLDENDKINSKLIIQNWGLNSRRQNSRWIPFSEL